MSTLYQTLGLPPGADRQQVKAAFRKLARCLHPDVNAGNAAAEQQFKELSAAYKTLMDPDARAAYDRALVRRQEMAKRRLRQMTTTAAAAGALSVSLTLFVLSWAQQPPAPDQNQSAETLSASTASAHGPGRGATWSTYGDSRFSFTLEYPADVFAVAQPTDNGALLTSADGRIRLRIFAARNITGTTLDSYRRFLLQNRYAGVLLDYTPRSKLWFVLSGSEGGEVIYEHIGFSCDNASIHGWQMVYPAHERTFYDLVADEIHRRTALTSLECGAVPPLPRPKPQPAGELTELTTHKPRLGGELAIR